MPVYYTDREKLKTEIQSEMITYLGSGHTLELTEWIIDNRIELETHLLEGMKDIPVINGLEDIDWYESELYHWYQSLVEDY